MNTNLHGPATPAAEFSLPERAAGASHSPDARGATHPDTFNRAGASTCAMVPGESPGRRNADRGAARGAHETALVPAPAPTSLCRVDDHPVGDPDFDRLPSDERARVVSRLAIMRRMDGASNKLAFLRRYPLPPERGWAIKSLLNLHTIWCTGSGAWESGNWRLLVDRRRAGKLWKSSRASGRYPREFVEAVQALFVENKRKTKPAIRKLYAWWYTGQRLVSGRMVSCPVPGYGTAVLGPNGERPAMPTGWSESHLRRLCRLTPSQLTLAREGIASARVHLPHVLTTRVGVRWLEYVMFDDVKLDWRVLDTVSGQVCDLWLLVAMDWGSACALGFWMRPALARDDGSQEHLRQSDMMQFGGWLLERYGLPRGHTCTWKVENGTATIEDAVAAALPGLFGDRLRVSYARMIGGKSSAGYQERGKGNSWAKAPLESFFNPLHNYFGDIPGQVGRRYDVRPADLAARETEARRIWGQASQDFVGDDLRGKISYPLLTVAEARPRINSAFVALNSRTDHAIEGFDDVVEAVYDQPGRFSRRKQSPFERAARLSQDSPTDRVPDLSLSVFYQATARIVRVDSKGEIEAKVDGRTYTYRAPDGARAIESGTRLVAHFYQQDPEYLYLSRPAPHAGYVATWSRRERIGLADAEALSAELHRTQSALKADRAAVAALATGERAALDQMRRSTSALMAEAEARRDAIDATAGELRALDDVQSIAPGRAAIGIAAARAAVESSAADRALRKEELRDLAEAADDALLARFS